MFSQVLATHLRKFMTICFCWEIFIICRRKKRIQFPDLISNLFSQKCFGFPSFSQKMCLLRSLRCHQTWFTAWAQGTPSNNYGHCRRRNFKKNLTKQNLKKWKLEIRENLKRVRVTVQEKCEGKWKREKMWIRYIYISDSHFFSFSLPFTIFLDSDPYSF